MSSPTAGYPGEHCRGRTGGGVGSPPCARICCTSHAGSATETGVSDLAGALATLGNTPTDPGTIDATGTPSGRYLYVQTGAEGS